MLRSEIKDALGEPPGFSCQTINFDKLNKAHRSVGRKVEVFVGQFLKQEYVLDLGSCTADALGALEQERPGGP